MVRLPYSTLARIQVGVIWKFKLVELAQRGKRQYVTWLVRSSVSEEAEFGEGGFGKAIT